MNIWIRVLHLVHTIWANQEREKEKSDYRNLTSEFEIIRNLSTPNSGYHAKQRGIAVCSILSMRNI